jgi:dephospho-CoA kinase
MTGCSRTSLVLGITGGLACGKSEVGLVLQKDGFMLCDADLVAHELIKKGNPVYKKVVDHFGLKILAGDGEISRPILGKTVFENPAERETLNQIVHPAVAEYIETWIADARTKNLSAAVLIPLLFESGMDQLDWDAVLCVSSSEDLVFDRLEKRGQNRKEAALRVASQMPLKQKKEQSDYVIPNKGTLAELEQFTRATVQRIMAKR